MAKEHQINHLKEWLDAASAYDPIEWERLPELELYMDQVITFLNKQLELFTMDGERLLTPSMINNYVKDGVLPRPVQKKYGREHLAMLMIIYMLKPVLSLPEIDATLQGLTPGDRSIKEVYPDFLEKQKASLKTVVERVKNAPDQEDDTLYRLALELALEANACHVTAARLLDCLMEREENREKEKGKEKNKKG